MAWAVCGNRYGLRSLVCAQLSGLVAGLRRYAAHDLRLRTFARLCAADKTPLPSAHHLAFYLRAVRATLDAQPAGAVAAAANCASGVPYLLSVERCQSIARTAFYPNGRHGEP